MRRLKAKLRRLPCLVALLLLVCAGAAADDQWLSLPAAFGAKFVPPADRTLLVVGQDLDSLLQYRKECTECPVPGGVTAYLGFYDLLTPGAHQFGGLGEDPNGEPTDDGDWGAGRTSARRAAALFPDSALVLGLDISNTRRENGVAEITRGVHDPKIARLAAFCRSLDKPIYLRLGYEFDGSWNPGYEQHRTYIGAWRHIVEFMRSQAVANVAYVWQASASPVDDVIDGRREDIRDWYPGAEYVDWVALSWFLTPTEAPSVGSYEPPTQLELADEVLALARSERKPVMIAEAAPQSYHIGKLTRSNISQIWDGPAGRGRLDTSPDRIWQQWYAPFFEYVNANRDAIRAVAYINAHWDAQAMWGPPYASGYWGDSRIQANDAIMSRWLAEIRKPVWQHGENATAVLSN